MFDEEQLARMMGMKRAGMKLKEIAKRFNCSINTISRVTRQKKCRSRIDGKAAALTHYLPSQHEFDNLE